MRRLFPVLIPVCALAFACGGGGGGGGGGNRTPTPVPITTLYVRTSGNDDNNGASPDTALRTIARATQMIGPGVTVYVGPGAYAGRVRIANTRSDAVHPITLIADTKGTRTGDDPGEVTIDGDEGSVALLVENAPFVTVDGFIITGVADDVVVRVRNGSDHFTISHSMVLETASVMGIRIESSDDALVYDTLIHVDNSGVRTVDAAGTRIVSNTIFNQRNPGVSIGAGSSATTVRNNIIQGDFNLSITVDDTARDSYDGDYNLVFSPKVADQTTIYRPRQLRGAHDINVDALFVDPEEQQFQLQPGSPAIDAADSTNVGSELLLPLAERSTAADGSRDEGPIDLGYHYPAAE